MSEGFEHRPVMVDEIVELFRPVPPGLIVDATVGGGGHAKALLDAVMLIIAETTSIGHAKFQTPEVVITQAPRHSQVYRHFIEPC